jgi:hypothetical protein
MLIELLIILLAFAFVFHASARGGVFSTVLSPPREAMSNRRDNPLPAGADDATSGYKEEDTIKLGSTGSEEDRASMDQLLSASIDVPGALSANQRALVKSQEQEGTMAYLHGLLDTALAEDMDARITELDARNTQNSENLSQLALNAQLLKAERRTEGGYEPTGNVYVPPN